MSSTYSSVFLVVSFYAYLIIRLGLWELLRPWEQVLQEQNASCAQFARTIVLSDFSLIAALAAANAGISFVYQAVADRYPQLCTFTLRGTQIVREFNCVCLKNTESPAKINYFLAAPQ